MIQPPVMFEILLLQIKFRLFHRLLGQVGQLSSDLKGAVTVIGQFDSRLPKASPLFKIRGCEFALSFFSRRDELPGCDTAEQTIS